MTHEALHLLFIMGSMNNFGQMGQDILHNKYLKTNFENLKIRDFLPTILKFRKSNFFLKIGVLFELQMYIS